MKNFLLISNYAPKLGFKYPHVSCPIKHRKLAHDHIYSINRFFSEPINWTTIRTEETDIKQLETYILSKKFDGIIISGSPYSIGENDEWIKRIQKATEKLVHSDHQTPVLGICFGAQLIAKIFGGKITRSSQFLKNESELILESGTRIPTKVFHQEYVSHVPKGTRVLAKSPEGMPYLLQYAKNIWGVQSHLEQILNCTIKNNKAHNFWQNFFQKWILGAPDTTSSKTSVPVKVSI